MEYPLFIIFQEKEKKTVINITKIIRMLNKAQIEEQRIYANIEDMGIDPNRDYCLIEMDNGLRLLLNADFDKVMEGINEVTFNYLRNMSQLQHNTVNPNHTMYRNIDS